MPRNRPRTKLEMQKANFLKGLGAKSSEDLYKRVLKKSFEGDPFEANIEATFCNYYLQEGKDCEEFYDSFLLWGEKKLDKAFKFRWRVAAANMFGLFGALGISFANPIAGVATGVAVSGAAAVAEGVAKRNVASFGHLQGHLSHKIHACTIRMIEKCKALDCLAPEAKQKLQKLVHPESKSKKSALARMASYFSGPLASGVNNLVSRFAGVSALASGVVGTFIPFLPLATYRLSRIASNMRHKSAISEGVFLNDVAEIIFDENSWTDKVRAGGEIEKLTTEFASELERSDNHGRIPSERKYHKAPAKSKDKNTNIKKGITFPAWLSAKFHKFIKRKILGGEVEDIAEKPAKEPQFSKETFEKVSEELNAKLEAEFIATSAKRPLLTKPKTKVVNHRSKPAFAEAASKPTVLAVKHGSEAEVNELLTNFSQLTKEPPKRRDHYVRSQQVSKQNEIIDNVVSKSRKFILKSKKINPEDNTTIFVYAHPDFQEGHPEYEKRQVIYVRNNDSGKTKVLHGEKAKAIIFERPNEEKNGLIVKIDNGRRSCYGELSNRSVFQNFEVTKSLPSVRVSSRQSSSLRALSGRSRLLGQEVS